MRACGRGTVLGGGQGHIVYRCRDRSEPSGSMVGNLISTVRSGIGRVMAALPPALRRSLRDSSAGSSVAGSEEDDGDASERSREDIKKDLLLGHLLGLLTDGSEGMPAHALPALAASLADSGVLPRWVQVVYCWPH